MDTKKYIHHDGNPQKKGKSFMYWLRLGTVFSAAVVFMSLLSNLGTQIGNRLISGSQQKTDVAGSGNGLLPYETPSMSIFDGLLVSEARAIVLGIPGVLIS